MALNGRELYILIHLSAVLCKTRESEVAKCFKRFVKLEQRRIITLNFTVALVCFTLIFDESLGDINSLYVGRFKGILSLRF